MNKRTAHAKKVRVNSLSYSSIFEIGDVHEVTPLTHALAIQKEGGIQSDEGIELSNFSIYERKPKILPEHPPIKQCTLHHTPHVYVNNIDVIGASSSSILQIGSITRIDSETRIKHIRVLEDEHNRNNEI